ncbi:MAG: ribonuclease H-like YkuK family protein [Thermoanaerobacteraceae bacterium]|nr:ribonuclease H-like YkuK family protein [Thermoanaerobacteraceae bacterium]
MCFISPSKGKLSLDEVYADIMDFIGSVPNAQYKIIIGSDSQAKNETCFVTAIIVHQVGKGARYYYKKKKHRKINSLRQKIFFETALSLDTASKITEKLAEDGHEDLNLEIHLDIGPNGETKELIRELVGMVVGSGFDAKIKPDSCGASKVADKYTK